ncbi:WAT1-related protein At2g37460-like [Salvia hispanica]|uniref:WAT1-related protein At2g37460-like n=1 Tax=Salvia hispanica TaxID=49212 RepID=UPI0020097B1C|nr:WAT1-related protein At2g37460-like [Salvia hispanica]
MNKGMRNYVMSSRHAVTTLVIGPFAFVFDSYTYMSKSLLMGMKYTIAKFATALCNILPAATFVMAWCFRSKERPQPSENTLHIGYDYRSKANSMGLAEGAAVALAAEKENAAAWAIKWDASSLAMVYIGVVMMERGLVFLTGFSPLSMVIVARDGASIGPITQPCPSRSDIVFAVQRPDVVTDTKSIAPTWHWNNTPVP